MATLDKLAKAATATAEQIETPPGTVGACTPEDRAALTDLYFSVYPNATTADLMADIRDEELQAWAAYRDEQGEIRVAMFVRSDGIVWVFARPADCESSEVKRGFLMLAEHVSKVLLPSGIRHLVIVHAASLGRLGDNLEREGFSSRVLNVVRVMHFTDSGEMIRAN